RIGYLDILADTNVAHLHVALVLAGTDAQKSDTVAVFRIHVGVDLEHEAGETAIVGNDLTGVGFSRLRCRREFDETVEHLAYAEVAHGSPEVDRSQLTAPIGLEIEGMGSSAYQFDFHAQLLGGTFTEHLVYF